jgi:ribosomal protein S18 acetylase RimI-like enzyme
MSEAVSIAAPSMLAAANMRVRGLVARDWQVLRKVRVAALQQSPKWLLGDAEWEQKQSARYWLRLIRRCRWVVAEVDDGPARRVIGVVQSIGHTKRRYLQGVWVDPFFRDQGVGKLLIECAIERELAAGILDLQIWVIDGNDAAKHVYGSIGFRSVGLPQQIRDDGRFEQRYRLDLEAWHAYRRHEQQAA